MNYLTLYEAKRQLGMLDNNRDEALITDWIAKSTFLIEWWKQRRYVPRFKQLLLDCPRSQSSLFGSYPIEGSYSFAVDREELPLHILEDLLEVIELKNGDGTAIEEYFLEPANAYPKSRIYLKSGNAWVPDGVEYRQAISLSGVFGYNSNYQNAWVDSGDTVLNVGGISTSDVLISVDDVNGIANDLYTPRFSVGMLLRIKEETDFEYMVVKEIVEDDYGNTLTVVRASNGTTAIEHPSGAKIEIYRIPGDIAQCCVRLVQWRYRQKDSDIFDKVYNFATQTAVTPSALPVDVREILGLRRINI